MFGPFYNWVETYQGHKYPLRFSQPDMLKRGGPSRLKVPNTVKWLIVLTSFSAIGYGYLVTAITAYLPEMGVSSSDIGLIIGASGLAMIFCAIPFGILSDRIGRKWILIHWAGGRAGRRCSSAPSPLDPTYFLAASIIAGIAEGALLSTWNAMIADQTTVDNRDLAFSLSFIVNGSFYGIGLALPFLFPYIQDSTGMSSAQVHSGRSWCSGSSPPSLP